MPKVSIIIPVYNVEKYIRECLDSVLKSTLEDIEIIIVDDGSKDKCPEIIDEYAGKESRIIAIHKENGGYGQACNVGLERASGEYVAVLEPDDYIDKDMYSDLYESAIVNNACIVKSKYIENYDIGSYSFQRVMPYQDFIPPKGVFTLDAFPQLMNIHPSIWSCIYKRSFLNENNIRFLEVPGAGWSDNMFQVQTLCLATRIAFINNAYYYWRKLYLDDSKALKDYTIPIKRSLEIRRWLSECNPDDNKISAFLFKRELSYFKIIHKILKFSEISEYKKLLKEYFEIANIDKIINQNEISKKERKVYNLLKNFPALVIIKDKIKFFMSNLIKFRLGKRNKYLYIFGFCVFRK